MNKIIRQVNGIIADVTSYINDKEKMSLLLFHILTL